MAGKGRTERRSRSREAAASAVVPLPRPAGDRLELARFIPSGRSLLLAFGVLVGAFAAYWGARSTSVFAVDRVEVRGAPPDVAREVRAATAGLVGTSLLSVDPAQVEGKVRLLPSVVAASVDRAFPHTLVVKVAAEHPVGIVRRGDGAWLVTGSGRVLRSVGPRSHPRLPRLWLPRQVPVAFGAELPTAYEPAARALGDLRRVRLRGGVKTVQTNAGELTLVLRDGRHVILGEPSDVLLKVAVAAQILRRLDAGLRYLDVSVPERPVASANVQVSS
jgi:cell division protein FtsQ